MAHFVGVNVGFLTPGRLPRGAEEFPFDAAVKAAAARATIHVVGEYEIHIVVWGEIDARRAARVHRVFRHRRHLRARRFPAARRVIDLVLRQREPAARRAEPARAADVAHP